MFLRCVILAVIAASVAFFARPANAQYTIGCSAPLNFDCSDPRPKPKPAEVEAKRLTLAFERGPPGWDLAVIDVAYRFLACAGEVQVAYSLDRSSIKVIGAYHARRRGGAVIVPDAVAPTQGPMTVSFVLTAVQHMGGYTKELREIRDAIAGESLGMGCVSGQTKTIGSVADLIGKDASASAVREALAAMELRAAWGQGIVGPLTLRATPTGDGSDVPSQEADRDAGDSAPDTPTEADRARAEAAAKAAAESRALTELNAANAAKAKAEIDAIRAQKEKYARDTADYDRRVAADAAAAAAEKARYEAEMERYRAEKARADAATEEHYRKYPKSRPK